MQFYKILEIRLNATPLKISIAQFFALTRTAMNVDRMWIWEKQKHMLEIETRTQKFMASLN